MKKRAVGLVLTTTLPDGRLVAVLQARGVFNTEKMGPESFPGACQVTAHGGLEEDEGWIEGLLREVGQELGDAVAAMISAARDSIVQLTRTDDGKKEVVTYGLRLCDCTFLRAIRFGPDSGGLRLVTASDPMVNLRSIEHAKERGVTDHRVIALFPDEMDAVQAALAR